MTSQNEKKELKSDNDNFSIVNEGNIKEGENITIKKSKILNEKAEKTICEIIKDKGYGSGFFLELNILINLMKYIA